MTWQKRKIWVIVTALTAAIVLVLFSGYYLYSEVHTERQVDYSVYQYHIAIISEEKNSSFWKDICSGAAEAGKSYGAYVEQTGEGLTDPPSIAEAVNMAIYENVDGILIRPSDSGEIREMIDKACALDIPVITLQKDIPDSKRQGFVGINDYFLGQEYGKRVLELADDQTRRVAVLFPRESFNESSRNWFCQGLSNTVQMEHIQIDFHIIWDDHGLNNAEDVIHDLLSGNADQPDILICLDDVITQSADQLIRDLGLSPQVRIIGSYVSDNILKGIEEGYIDSTITIDPEVMGRMGIDALMTYKRYHMVSYYTEVDTQLVEQSNVADFRRENGDETE
ncbi:MAG TPA: substrate-binding domain-containing protein [Candidatus Enterocloster excrementigallinarum]|uniref:Substrate-binding domain-containing protein n=1 Tax=Candidatus Enterocloster excrementigallinarum TaxID=2838558 RepID=A0A9D2PXF0_9FIRM|nr:substrate-binding domain-containing protein [Candidatus Enterocloster excrementigallinarum]